MVVQLLNMLLHKPDTIHRKRNNTDSSASRQTCIISTGTQQKFCVLPTFMSDWAFNFSIRSLEAISFNIRSLGVLNFSIRSLGAYSFNNLWGQLGHSILILGHLGQSVLISGHSRHSILVSGHSGQSVLISAYLGHSILVSLSGHSGHSVLISSHSVHSVWIYQVTQCIQFEYQVTQCIQFEYKVTDEPLGRVLNKQGLYRVQMRKHILGFCLNFCYKNLYCWIAPQNNTLPYKSV